VVAVITTGVELETENVGTLKVVLFEPAGTLTLAGMATALLLLAINGFYVYSECMGSITDERQVCGDVPRTVAFCAWFDLANAKVSDGWPSSNSRTPKQRVGPAIRSTVLLAVCGSCNSELRRGIAEPVGSAYYGQQWNSLTPLASDKQTDRLYRH